jgi:hypothetical protein
MNPLFCYLHRKSREKKHRLLRELLRPTPGMRVLNIGATGAHTGLAEQLEAFYPYPGQITGGGPNFHEVMDYHACFPEARALVFDGCALPFADQSFDVAYCNAVLEHLPPCARPRLAAEIRRVARGWFVTTPNLWYPIEPHYHLPLVQFLSQPAQRRLARRLGRVPYDELQLLGRGDLRRLFPQGKVIGCRVTFYPETLIAYKAPQP